MSEITVACACGAPMIERINTLNQSTFLGCSRYPDCRETQKVPAFVEVKRSGGLELPGFESVPTVDAAKVKPWTA